MASINDWAAKAARKIHDGLTCISCRAEGDSGTRFECSTCAESRDVPSAERIAAIIAIHARPLLDLLQKSQRKHDLECPMFQIEFDEDVVIGYEDGPCTCGAAEWNARVDRVLEGREPRATDSKGQTIKKRPARRPETRRSRGWE